MVEKVKTTIYILVGLSACLSEISFALWSYALTHGMLILSLTATFFWPLINLLNLAMFIDAESWSQRILVALVMSVGYVIGTGLVFWIVGNL